MRGVEDRVLVWNMGFFARGNPDAKLVRSRLDILRRLVARCSPGIVALQEAPSAPLLEATLGPPYLFIRGMKGLVTAFHAETWRVVSYSEGPCERALLAEIDSCDHGSRLCFWNVHFRGHPAEPIERREYVRGDFRDYWRAIRARTPDREELMVGDFNMDPYDVAMVRSDGLHANRCYEWVLSQSSTREDTRRPLFNPTWGLLGLRSQPQGTVYTRKRGGGPWYVPDQALMSPALAIPGEEQVQIMGARGLYTRRVQAPNRKVGSDHLPISVRFRVA